MSNRSAQAAAYALCCALSSGSAGTGCANEAPAQGKPKPVLPPYDLLRPTDGLPAPQPRAADFRRGISLGLFVSSQEDEIRKPLYKQFLDEIKDQGASDIELVVRWSQTDVSAIEISPHSIESVDDDLLTWVMDEANERDLRVFLMPILDVEDRSMGRWRGTLAPADWDRWWWSYQRFIMHYARLAGGHKASLFSVGSELLSTEQQSDRWRGLIADVRKVYSGQLTYSANWDHFEPVSFWDALDVVGITGYHELVAQASVEPGRPTATPASAGGIAKASPNGTKRLSAPNAARAASGPSDEALLKGFAPFVHRLRSWAMAEGHRYLFTEVGYPAQAHAALRPWDYRISGPADPLLQLRCYRALFKTFHGDPRLTGLYMWNWFGEGGLKDGSYTPRGKPAAKVLEHWYRGSMSPADRALRAAQLQEKKAGRPITALPKSAH